MLKRIFNRKNRALLAELVRTDFKLRYQGSVLGYAWSLLRPLLMFLIIYIVFVKFFPLGKGIPHYPIYLLLGIVIWNFFDEMTSQSLTSIVSRGDLIRKIRIPRWTIILSASLAALINLVLNLIVVAVFMVMNQVHFQMSIIWVPLILLEVYLFALGLSLFLSAAYVRFRDLSYIWDVVLQAGFYLTAIIYPISKITNETFKKLIMINPMSQTIQDARYHTVTKTASTTSEVFGGGPYKFAPFVIVVTVFVGGALYFRKKSRYFAEDI